MKEYSFHVDADWDRASGEQARGNSTASPLNVRYRTGEIATYVASHPGTWLDYGCADGGYAEALVAAGASKVVGVDPEAPRIEEATRRQIPGTSFVQFDGHVLPFEDASFDGAFANETMEHVFNESESLAELHRVLKPGGILVVISPNRWFPFEGHTTRIGRWQSSPTPFIPWLPARLTASWVDARNYWPHQLRSLIRENGFTLVQVGFIWPVFEVMPWLPASVIRWYQKHLNRFARLPLLCRFGVSNLVVGRRA
jgi:ubiquinone/menaquinone biosynthesis C-methylase UbiE